MSKGLNFETSTERGCVEDQPQRVGLGLQEQSLLAIIIFQRLRLDLASIGPRPFSHGDDAFHQSKRHTVTQLQLGHSLAAMVTLGHVVLDVDVVVASTEPRPLSHGDPWGDPPGWAARRSFNGATTLQPW